MACRLSRLQPTFELDSEVLLRPIHLFGGGVV